MEVEIDQKSTKKHLLHKTCKKSKQPSQTTVFTTFFKGPALQNPPNSDDFQPTSHFENRYKFLARCLRGVVGFGLPFGLILEPKIIPK